MLDTTLAGPDMRVGIERWYCPLQRGPVNMAGSRDVGFTTREAKDYSEDMV
jgi:hypothetical protein